MGELTEARTLNEQVLEILQRTLGDEHPDTLTSMTNLAMVLEAMAEPEAIKHWAAALPIAERVWGEQHQNTTAIRNRLS